MIFNIRGTNGSGKSHIVHRLLKKYDHETILEGEKVIGYYLPDLDLHVVGAYQTVCGGCDRIADQDRVEELVREFTCGHVLFEGLLVSHTFQRWADLFEELGVETHVLFLDTPMEECIERVKQRRLAQGNEKPYDPKNLIKDWHCARRVAARFTETDCKVYWMNGDQILQHVERAITDV